MTCIVEGGVHRDLNGQA